MQTQRVLHPAAQQGEWSFVPQNTHNQHPAPTVVSAVSAPPLDQHVKLKLLRKHCHARNRAMWAHALVLFNVIGIPLSRGIYLEYNFTSDSTRTFSTWAFVVAFQYLWLLSMPLLVGYFRAQTEAVNRFRYAYLGSMLVLFAAQFVQQWLHAAYIATLILEGIVVPCMLGILFSLSTLELSKHYQANIPLVSMQSGFASFTGAVVYTVLGRQKFLLARELDMSHIIQASIGLGTLLLAWLLTRPVSSLEGKQLENPRTLELDFPHGLKGLLKEDGTIWFLLGSFFIFASIFTFPTFIVLLLARPPTLHEPADAAIVLLATFTTAAFSACIAANASFRRHLGPVDTLIASSIFSGAACLLLTFMPAQMGASIIVGAAYGIGLGAFAAIYVKTTTLFHEERGWSDDMPARAALMMMLGGLAAFGSILGGAVILEKLETGGKIAMMLAAVELMVGGVFIGIARWRRCRYWRIVI